MVPEAYPTHTGRDMHITALYRYPLKGFSPEALESVALQVGQGMPGDRRFALAHAAGGASEGWPFPRSLPELGAPPH